MVDPARHLPTTERMPILAGLPPITFHYHDLPRSGWTSPEMLATGAVIANRASLSV